MDATVVIGGGFAGLSAAVHLAQRGHRVTLLERRQQLGGRAYSFTDPQTGDTVDNGQHLFMKCYRATRDFLALIGAADGLSFQRRFTLEFRDLNNAPSRLAFPAWPAPLNLLWGFLRFKAVALGDVLALRTLDLKSDLPRDLSVAAWLTQCGQKPRMRRAFWYPLCIAALNEPPDRASARHLQAVLREAFFGPADGALIGHARTGLSALYTRQAQSFIEAHGGKVIPGSSVETLRIAPDSTIALHLRSGEDLHTPTCICAVPPPALEKILPPEMVDLRKTLALFEPSPILSVNLWYDRPITTLPFMGLLGTEMEWLFNKPLLYGASDRASEGHVTLVASAARHLADRPEAELIGLAQRELGALLPEVRKARLRHARVVCEHRATYSLPLGSCPPGTRTHHPGLFLAGDWTDTGLPGTIESAVRSGVAAAEAAAAFPMQ